MQMILCTTSSWCLGTPEGVPWFDAEEVKRFHSLTLGGTLVMGRKTYELDLPWMRRARKVVLSRQPLELPGATVFNTITEVARTCPDAWVVGGQMTFQAFLPHTRFIYLTRHPCAVQGTIGMPEIAWSLWSAAGKTVSHDREMTILVRKTLARTQSRADSGTAATKRKEEAKSSR